MVNTDCWKFNFNEDKTNVCQPILLSYQVVKKSVRNRTATNFVLSVNIKMNYEFNYINAKMK